MSTTFPFERSHDIVIQASPDAVLDYVSNPQTWKEWMPATHDIDCPNRPLREGETFSEEWHTRSGAARLDWRVTGRVDAKEWLAETHTDFTGPIQCHYGVESVDGGTRYVRTIMNPARPKPVSDEMLARIDDEAALCLSNIKRNVEARSGT